MPGRRRPRGAWALAALLAGGVALARGSDAAGARVVVLALDGAVEPASLRYLERGLDEAARRGAALVLLELDTPGGLVTSLRKMTSAITSSPVPVVAYVTPPGAHAASAGFFLLLASDVAAMAPGTNTGAAAPVSLGGDEAEGAAAKKATEDVAALARALAQQRGRPVGAAEAAVREARSFGAAEAVKAGLVTLVAKDRAALLEALDGQTVQRFDGRATRLDLSSPTVETIAPTLGERALMTIAHPEIAYLLLLVGLLGLLVELTSPGLVVPGVVGAIALLMALFALSVLPVSLVGVLLVVAALALFVAEALVTSYGLLAIAGLLTFVLGSLMLVDAPWPGAGVGLETVLPSALVLGAATVFLITRAVRARRLPPTTGLEALAGEEGEVVEALAPQGKVFVHGEYWDAVADEVLPEGARVRVIGVEGRLLHVTESERSL